jgi:cytochrome P450
LWFGPLPRLLKKTTRRCPNEHLSFGDGIHFCLDAASARIQERVAITMLPDSKAGLPL